MSTGGERAHRARQRELLDEIERVKASIERIEAAGLSSCQTFIPLRRAPIGTDYMTLMPCAPSGNAPSVGEALERDLQALMEALRALRREARQSVRRSARARERGADQRMREALSEAEEALAAGNSEAADESMRRAREVAEAQLADWLGVVRRQPSNANISSALGQAAKVLQAGGEATASGAIEELRTHAVRRLRSQLRAFRRAPSAKGATVLARDASNAQALGAAEVEVDRAFKAVFDFLSRPGARRGANRTRRP